MFFERLTRKLYDYMTHDTDKFQNLTKIVNAAKILNSLRSLLVNA